MAEKNRQPTPETSEEFVQESTQTPDMGKMEKREETIRDTLPPPDPPGDTEKE